MNKTQRSPVLPCLAGFCTLALALGLGRFAYTPILPALVRLHWLNTSLASFIGTINFIGYLAGAIMAKPLTNIRSPQFWIKTSLILCAMSLIACIFHVNVAWIMFWRFIAGISGAVLMVLTPAVIYNAIEKHHIDTTAGIIFSGIGVAIVYSGIVVPIFSKVSIGEAWLSIAIVATIIAAIAFITLPKAAIGNNIPKSATKKKKQTLHWNRSIVLLACSYALFGIGSVPHFLFVINYIEEILQYSSKQADTAWILYGIGNAVGTPIFGYIANKIGTGITLIILLLIATVGVAILFLSNALWVADLSYALIGIVAISIVSLASSYLAELASLSELTGFWSILTIVFAISQAGASAVMSGWVSEPNGYDWIFATGSVAMFIAAILIGMLKRHRSKKL